jgi:hypothetical protein
MFGGQGDDVNLWAPGDGSEAFIGGPGRDALIFGATDRETLIDPNTGVALPVLFFGVPGFPKGIRGQMSVACRIPARWRTAPRRRTSTWCASGMQPATSSPRFAVSEVEQVFCSQGGSIAFADLTAKSPTFEVVSLGDVKTLNSLVGAMIR